MTPIFFPPFTSSVLLFQLCSLSLEMQGVSTLPQDLSCSAQYVSITVFLRLGCLAKLYAFFCMVGRRSQSADKFAFPPSS